VDASRISESTLDHLTYAQCTKLWSFARDRQKIRLI